MSRPARRRVPTGPAVWTALAALALAPAPPAGALAAGQETPAPTPAATPAAVLTVVRDVHVPTTGSGVGNALALLPDGGWVAVGYDEGRGLDDPAGPPTPARGVLARFSADGELVWRRDYAGEGPGGDRRLWDAVPVEGGGYFLVGFAGPSGQEDVWALRVDSAGEPIWERRWGGRGSDRAWAATPDGAGGWYVAAEATSAGRGRRAGWVLRVDAAGDTAWTRTLEAPNAAVRTFSVAATPSGDALVTGGSGSDDRSGGDNDALIVRLAPDGELRWLRVMGDARYDVGHGVVAEGEDAVVTGYGTPGGNADGDTDLAVVRIDREGAPVWRTFFGTTAHERGMMSTPAARDGAGGWIGVGFRVLPDDVDALLWRVDEEGGVRWEAALPWPGADRGVMARALGGGRVVVTGAFGRTDRAPSTFRVLVLEVGPVRSGPG